MPATPPLALDDPGAAGERLTSARVDIDGGLRDDLASAGVEVIDDPATLTEAGRDWWPLALPWALAGSVVAKPALVARPATTGQVAATLRACSRRGVPVTAAGGRSGVCGASVPVHGGVTLDLTALTGIVAVDDESLVATVLPGTFGDALEAELRSSHELTLGHWPQSIALSTVGGWLACRSAGQYSTRYGKIEDMVVGLEVVLADGTTIETGGAPRAAVGPDLTQLFVGSEGTLGVVTRAELRCHPSPPAEVRSAWSFPSFVDGLDACRRILRRGATPAVLRLYDEVESARSHGVEGRAVLLVLDEGDEGLIAAGHELIAAECAGAERLGDDLVERWMGHRNDVSALEGLSRKGFVVDTMEVAGSWAALPRIYAAGVAALQGVDGVLAASAHQSHSYLDGACIYFSFAGRPPAEERERFYVACWDAAQRAVLAEGGALSHHHGVGLNRSRFMAEALGAGLGVLQSVKDALDPAGVLNPGKLGLVDRFGDVGWPRAQVTASATGSAPVTGSAPT